MRSVRMATCTSGEPVSPDLWACSLMSAVLRSAVIDIGILLSLIVPGGPSGATSDWGQPGRDVVQRGRGDAPGGNPCAGLAHHTQNRAESQPRSRAKPEVVAKLRLGRLAWGSASVASRTGPSPPPAPRARFRRP